VYISDSVSVRVSDEITAPFTEFFFLSIVMCWLFNGRGLSVSKP